MKKVWLEVPEWDEHLVLRAIELGVDALVAPDSDTAGRIAELSRVEVIDRSAPKDNVAFVTIDSKSDEEAAAAARPDVRLVVETGDWRIIPFENVLAVRGNVIAAVSSLAEAEEASGILERGTDGVYVRRAAAEEKLRVLTSFKGRTANLDLAEGVVEKIDRLPVGDRVCLDTISLLRPGEGMLVGDYSHGLALISAETADNPYVAARPFRVNAGAVHCYLQVPGGKTRYLSELESGDPLLIVSHDGTTRSTVVGRVKLEVRPMLRVAIRGPQRAFSVVLQNAETVRLVSLDGSSKSVVSLEVGDKVAVLEQQGGRHFGHAVQETISEK